MTQARGRRLDGGVEVAALKPCTLTVVEGRWRQVFSFNSPLLLRPVYCTFGIA
jgi:hypothetical protein